MLPMQHFKNKGNLVYDRNLQLYIVYKFDDRSKVCRKRAAATLSLTDRRRRRRQNLEFLAQRRRRRNKNPTDRMSDGSTILFSCEVPTRHPFIPSDFPPTRSRKIRSTKPTVRWRHRAAKTRCNPSGERKMDGSTETIRRRQFIRAILFSIRPRFLSDEIDKNGPMVDIIL